MHKAAYYGFNDLIMRIANANPKECNIMMNEKDRDGNTPLHLAVKKDQFRAVKSLLLMGVEMNIQNKNGDTALHIAMDLKDYKTARYLHQSGANADLKNKKGLTPRDIAAAHARDIPPDTVLKPHEDPLKVFV
jgi:ankyrin repeat protein